MGVTIGLNSSAMNVVNVGMVSVDVGGIAVRVAVGMGMRVAVAVGVWVIVDVIEGTNVVA